MRNGHRQCPSACRPPSPSVKNKNILMCNESETVTWKIHPNKGMDVPERKRRGANPPASMSCCKPAGDNTLLLGAAADMRGTQSYN